MHLVRVLLALFRLDAEAGEQLHVLIRLRVAGGQELLSIKDGIGAGEEGQRLHLLVHLLAAGRQAHVRFGHHDAGNGQHADEVEGVNILLVRQRGTLHLDQHIDRHALRVLRQVGQLNQQTGAILKRLAHAENPARADFHTRVTHMRQGFQPIGVGPGGDDVAVELGRGVEVVVVVIQPGFGQRLGLLLAQLAQGHAGFHAQRLDTLDHLQHIGHVLGRRMFPGRAHAEAGGANGLGIGRRLEHLLDLHELFLVQTGVVMTGLRTVLAVFRARTGLDRQQRGDLHPVRVEVHAMHRLCLKQQIIERLIEQLQHFCQSPVVAGHGCSHGVLSLRIGRGTGRVPSLPSIITTARRLSTFEKTTGLHLDKKQSIRTMHTLPWQQPASGHATVRRLRG